MLGLEDAVQVECADRTVFGHGGQEAPGDVAPHCRTERAPDGGPVLRVQAFAAPEVRELVEQEPLRIDLAVRAAKRVDENLVAAGGRTREVVQRVEAPEPEVPERSLVEADFQPAREPLAAVGP